MTSDVLGPWARFDDLVAGTALRFGPVRRELVAHRPDEVTGVLDTVERLTGGGDWAFGFVVYEAAPGLDRGLAVHEPADGLPLAWFAVTAPPAQVPVVEHGATLPAPAASWAPAWTARAHAQAVGALRARIAEGETYQCNLTTHLHGPAPDDALQLYGGLALGQRGAHNACLDTGRFVVASASPELFFEVRGSRILMRPMKGTAARGRTTIEDARIVTRLRSSAKERAENVMIVDLVRNNLARLAACRASSGRTWSRPAG